MNDAELRAMISTSLLELIARVVVYNTAVSPKLGLGAGDSQFLTLLQNHGPLTAGRLRPPRP